MPNAQRQLAPFEDMHEVFRPLVRQSILCFWSALTCLQAIWQQGASILAILGVILARRMFAFKLRPCSRPSECTADCEIVPHSGP